MSIDAFRVSAHARQRKIDRVTLVRDAETLVQADAPGTDAAGRTFGLICQSALKCARRLFECAGNKERAAINHQFCERSNSRGTGSSRKNATNEP